MLTVITPFKRKENLPYLEGVLKGKCNWIVLIDDPALKDIFPEWVEVRLYEKRPEGIVKSNSLFNEFIRNEDKAGKAHPYPRIQDDTQYMILCDDDSVEDGFFEKIPDKDCILVSMKRGDRPVRHVVWTDFKNQMGYWNDGLDILIASKENLRIAGVGGEQLIIKGKYLKRYRYGLSNIGDGEMILRVADENEITYVPDAYVLFNYFEDGRYSTFRRPRGQRMKPVVLFIGDYFCAGQPSMGLSEWEGNIWASLESTGLAEVARFHMDKYYYHTGKRGDSALVERIDDIQPDYIVLIIYKHFGQDPAVMLENTMKVIRHLNVPVITIWGDLEAQQQRDIVKTVAPYCKKIVGTANKEIVEGLGYTYMHVPKDPRLFNDPNMTRDIDVVFSGSYGLGREERQKALGYLIDNGIKLVCGGSEGRDHFTTQDYADRYKRAKISISFSKAHGINVVNARPFEAMSCGSLLLEQKSPELAKLYTPGVDYVEWTDEVDLLEKVRYYLSHDDERTLIATYGRNKTEQLYSANKFWEDVLK